MSSILIFIVYRTVFIKKASLKMIWMISALGIMLSGAVGVFRLGDTLAMGGIVENLFSEFMFTSLSLFNYLRDWDLALFKFPIFLISDFTYLIPTYLFPTKDDGTRTGIMDIPFIALLGPLVPFFLLT